MLGILCFLTSGFLSQSDLRDDYEKVHDYMRSKIKNEDESLRAGIGKPLDVHVQLFVEDITNLNQVRIQT